MGAHGMLRLIHWGPLLAMSVITCISISAIICGLQWWPIHTLGGAVNMAIFLMWVVLTLYNLFTAAITGPGYVPLGWKPEKESDCKYLQFCSQCEGYKAPRSHHCRKCQRCVMKMDHHCPWINNCVGHHNHGSFTAFLFFAPCGCIHALCILIPAMYRAINREVSVWTNVYLDPSSGLSHDLFVMAFLSCSLSVGVTLAVGFLLYIQTYYIYYGSGREPLVHLGIKSFIGCMFAVGLAIGVIIAVGALFYIQMKSILKNETGIESWIIEKAYYRDLDEGEPEFVYPYNLGKWNNFKLVFHWKPRPELNGIWWPVIEGCDQYTLTVEQIKQKREKKERSVEYTIQEKYSGSYFPITMGPQVCCCPPCTDEPRIAVNPGDRIVVTRWKKRWLYGDKLITDNELKRSRRIRGWFPRRCAVEVINGTYEELVSPSATSSESVKRKSD